MPRIPEDNRRYRSREELCADIAFILKADVAYGTKYAVLSEATWVWTEFEGKYKGCEHWSKAAKKFRDNPKMLVHEHVVPKSTVIAELWSLPDKTPDSVRRLMDELCKGAVITREEDASLNSQGFRSKMPDDWDHKDPWARYNAAGIKM
jgi:hypothetical protein